MNLSQIVVNSFTSTVRQRGLPYFRSGKVKIVEGNTRLVRATVRGGGLYKVVLTLEDDFIEASCTCPYAGSYGDLCKHIWAVVLACDNTRYLQGTMGWRGDLYVELAGTEDEYDDDYDEEDEFDEDEIVLPHKPQLQSVRDFIKQARVKKRARTQKAKLPEWKTALSSLSVARSHYNAAPGRLDWPPGRELLYLVDVEATRNSPALVMDLMVRHRKKSDGQWTKLKSFYLPARQLAELPDEMDRQILTVLLGAKESYTQSSFYMTDDYSYRTFPRYQLTKTIQEMLLPQICATGRCRLRQFPDQQECPVLEWDASAPWQFGLNVTRDEAQQQYVVTGVLQRDTVNGAEQLLLTEPQLLIESGLVFTGQKIARLEHGDAFKWIALMRSKRELRVAFADGQDFIEALLKQPQLPPLLLPEELRFEEGAVLPQPGIRLKQGQNFGWSQKLSGEVSFKYDSKVIEREDAVQGVYFPERRLFLRRNRVFEAEAFDYLRELGFQEQRYYYAQQGVLELPSNKLPRVVRDLVAHGWQVEAEGKLYRTANNFNVAVNSGIDWFELHGTVDYGGITASLPELLAAMKRGDNTVKLGDGTFGLLPEEWLKKYAAIAGLGEAEDDHVRFKKSQAGFLDAMLAAQPGVQFDERFNEVREELKSFAGIEPGHEPAGFTGELRPYQRDALGWFEFLRRFGFGGCLADDMGLGKTIQVLSLLESRREARAKNTEKQNGKKPTVTAARTAPSLVVLPKSLVFNWRQEAARFTPQLRVLDHTGQLRSKKNLAHFEDYDLILTTYGTLRNDAALFKDVQFDYVILDEAQAIKNADTASSKAARLLNGNYKLALSGTPIENHLGELWSLFDFLNPGLLGSSSMFNSGFSAGAGRNPDEDTRKMLAQSLRPFILRRTKEQVAKDLPPKLEQTIFCEMETAQRKRYDELRDHYRGLLLNKIEADGLAKSKIVILEALLRLRQAACHPGLLDKTKKNETSAKLDVLLPQLQEVADEGHKALVFSQFTSFLSIVRDHLDKERVVYEYLDGKTKDRQARVERFQNDPNCRLFLISLKAGGLGLNLTAAEYVFLLDPWWNPAVEAQAIDRAHRIGQTQRVFAYRIIARDTVEEKVLELQNTKRDLADAIINADNSLIRNLKREDLELLLS